MTLDHVALMGLYVFLGMLLERFVWPVVVSRSGT